MSFPGFHLAPGRFAFQKLLDHEIGDGLGMFFVQADREHAPVQRRHAMEGRSQEVLQFFSLIPEAFHFMAEFHEFCWREPLAINPCSLRAEARLDPLEERMVHGKRQQGS